MTGPRHNSRDRALITVTWTSGARGDLLDVRIGNAVHDYGLQITVDGTGGRRSLALVPSVPYLDRWL